MNAAPFLAFLGRLPRAHQTPEVQEWLGRRGGRSEVFELPRRAPEGSPDEYLSNDLKGKANEAGLPHDEREVRSRIRAFVRKLVHLPERVRSYFQHPFVQYAAL